QNGKTPFRSPQRASGFLALDGIAQRPSGDGELPRALDQVVLCARLHRLHGNLFVVQRRKHHHRQVGCVAVQVKEGGQPLAVGQAQVEQRGVKGLLGKQRQRLAQAIHHGQTVARLCFLRQRIAQEEYIGGIVLNQQDVK